MEWTTGLTYELKFVHNIFSRDNVDSGLWTGLGTEIWTGILVPEQ